MSSLVNISLLRPLFISQDCPPSLQHIYPWERGSHHQVRGDGRKYVVALWHCYRPCWLIVFSFLYMRTLCTEHNSNITLFLLLHTNLHSYILYTWLHLKTIEISIFYNCMQCQDCQCRDKISYLNDTEKCCNNRGSTQEERRDPWHQSHLFSPLLSGWLGASQAWRGSAQPDGERRESAGKTRNWFSTLRRGNNQ